MNISSFTTPDSSVKSCLVYLTGNWPPRSGFYVAKDLNLPTRLYPNAKFLIRCNTDEKSYDQNYKFFSEIYKGFPFKLTTDKQTYENLKVDVIFFIHFNFVFFGGKVDRYTADKQFMLENTRAKVHILFNEEVTKTFEGLHSYALRRNDAFRQMNRPQLGRLRGKEDWSNVTLICNEDKFGQWVNDRPTEDIARTINVSYLSDIILYDLPDKSTLKCSVRQSESPVHKGLYIGNFSDPRVSWWNKHMHLQKTLDIKVIGPSSDKLKHYTGQGKSIDNSSAKYLLGSGEFSYSIYFGKGSKSLYLGATFYEPILNGLPLFIWEGTDPEHKLFPELPYVYFTDSAHLEKLLATYTSEQLAQLWEQEINTLFQ